MLTRIGDCSSCPSRHFCKELCGAAEMYVGIDTIKQSPNEHLSGLLPPLPLPHVENLTKLTKTEKKIVTLLGQGLTRTEVCEMLKINRHSLRNHLYKIKNKHVEK